MSHKNLLIKRDSASWLLHLLLLNYLAFSCFAICEAPTLSTRECLVLFSRFNYYYFVKIAEGASHCFEIFLHLLLSLECHLFKELLDFPVLIQVFLGVAEPVFVSKLLLKLCYFKNLEFKFFTRMIISHRS